MKKIFINNKQVSKLNEDAKIIDLKPDVVLPSEDGVISTNNNYAEVLKVLEALVDKVMESASNVREYILNIDEDLDEETNEYVNMVDEKMKYILSELF